MDRIAQRLDKPLGPAGAAARQTRQADLRHVSILLIDDDPQAQALIDMALIDAHFERKIEVVTTAAAGLERIKADDHDIYLVDHRLPDGTGLDVISAAKHLGTDKPFILMTGYGSGALDEAAPTSSARSATRFETGNRRGNCRIVKNSSGSLRRWRQSAGSPAASRTISTIC
jgi:CheY-like chemotaxis protein